MDYIVGAGLLFGAVLTIALGRMLLKHPGAPADQEAFGTAEAIAFVFTVLLAGGVSLVAARALNESSLESLIQMTVALATAGAASVVAWVALGRVSRRRERARVALPAGSPDAPRRGRPAGSAFGHRDYGRTAAEAKARGLSAGTRAQEPFRITSATYSAV